MYDFKQDFTDYQKLVPNADLTVKTPPTGTTEPQGYDFTQDFESYRKIAPDMSGLESVNDPLIKKAQIAQQKQEEEDKKKLQLAADLQLQSGYTPTPESVSSAQMTEGAKKSLAGMQDKILGKAGVITQRFGNRNSIEKFSGGVNYGTDIGVPKGTKVSVPPGKWKVIEAFGGAEEGKQAANRGYGNSILVQNQETGEKLRFSHLQDVGVKPGEIVDGNKIVGTVGLTGNTTGPHLDLEMYDRSGRLIDILETPYSSYLGLGQGGGTGKGGGNPMMDKITQVGRDLIGAIGNTPILPFIPQITPNSMASFRAPLEQQTQNIPQSVRNAFPITQIPEQVGSTVRQIGRFASLKPDAMDIATAPLMFMGGVKAKEIPVSSLKKISTTDRQIMGDFVTAIENGEAKKVLGNLGKDAENIAVALGIPETSTNKTIAKHFNDILESMDKKGIKPLMDKEIISKPPSVGGVTSKKGIVQAGNSYADLHGVDPEQTITVYRGVKASQYGKLKGGEWVTQDKELARLYARNRAGHTEDAKIISQKVKAKDLIIDPSTNPGVDNEFRFQPVSGGEIEGTTLYHGSDKVFDEMKVGQPTKRRMMMGEYDTTSHGMFFTPDKKIAGEYGKNVGEYRVNVKNPLDFRDRKNDAIFNEFDKLIENDPTIDMKPGEPGFSEFMYFDGELGKKFTQFIKNKGFDGAKLTETSEFSKGTFDTIVALDNAQVKNNKSLSGEIGGIDKLAQEAKKYKSAEEFIKAQGSPLFHGTNAEFKTFDKSKIGSATDEGFFGKGFYFANTENFARIAPGGRGAKNIMEAYPSPDAKLFDISSIKDKKAMADLLNMSEDALIQDVNGIIRPIRGQSGQFTSHLKDLGYDGAVVKRGGDAIETVIFEPDKIKTRQQLIDIYNKSVSGEIPKRSK